MSLALAASAAALLLLSPPPGLPLQRALSAALMPDFELRAFEAAAGPAHRTLRAGWVSRRHLVLQGRVVDPGVEVQAETPLRHGPLLAGVALLAAAVALWRRPRALPAALCVSLPVAALLALATGPLVLAGQVWGLALPPWSEPSWAAVLVGVSGLLLDGAGYAVAAVAAVAARAVAR